MSSVAEKVRLEARSESLTRGISWALIRTFVISMGNWLQSKQGLGESGGWVTYLDRSLKCLKVWVWPVWTRGTALEDPDWFWVGRDTPVIVWMFVLSLIPSLCLSLFAQNVAWPLSKNIMTFVIIADTFCLYNSHMNILGLCFLNFFSFFLLHFTPLVYSLQQQANRETWNLRLDVGRNNSWSLLCLMHFLSGHIHKHTHCLTNTMAD